MKWVFFIPWPLLFKESNLFIKGDVQYQCVWRYHLPQAYVFPEEMFPCRSMMSNVKDIPALTGNLIKYGFKISVKEQMLNWKPERSKCLSFPLAFLLNIWIALQTCSTPSGVFSWKGEIFTFDSVVFDLTLLLYRDSSNSNKQVKSYNLGLK